MFRLLSTSITAAALIGQVVGLATPNLNDNNQAAVWQPKVGSTYQIILHDVIDVSKGITPNVEVVDIDLFYTPAATIQTLKNAGKKVICYFSAGTSEDWRDDWSQFQESDKGSCLPEWSGERWLNVNSANVWKIMAARIALASQKGCDGIDPDNMDGYSSEAGNGAGLTQQDSASYLKKLAAEAAKYGMATGLKNAQGLLSSVQSSIQFAVNEECAAYEGDCAAYRNFGKPVYHIEYVNSRSVSSSQLSQMCMKNNPTDARYFTTVIKTLNLDGWVTYCDGSSATTPTTSDGVEKGKNECKANSP